MSHEKAPILFPRGIIIFQGVLTKFNFSTKFPHLEIIVYLMKDLKCEHQSTFPLWWRVKLILGTGTENQIFILRTPATIKFFHQILKNCHFGVKKNHYPSRWICRRHIKAPVLFPRGIIMLQGVLIKFNFLMKFPHLEIIIDLMKDLKYEHQSTFPLCGRVKLNFRDRYRKPNIYSKNSSHYQVFSSNSQKLSLWCKQKIITHPDGFI